MNLVTARRTFLLALAAATFFLAAQPLVAQQRPRGVIVVRVFPHTAAANLWQQVGGEWRRVRLEPADLIVRINGLPINHPRDFERIINDMDHGADFDIVVRDSRTLRLMRLEGSLDQGGGYRFGAKLDTNTGVVP